MDLKILITLAIGHEKKNISQLYSCHSAARVCDFMQSFQLYYLLLLDVLVSQAPLLSYTLYSVNPASIVEGTRHALSNLGANGVTIIISWNPNIWYTPVLSVFGRSWQLTLSQFSLNPTMRGTSFLKQEPMVIHRPL